MQDYENVKIPFLSIREIEKLASDFISQYWLAGKYPVEMMDIVEHYLKIRIWPIPGLEDICGSDCCISSDWKTVFIDKTKYEDELNRWDKRINFSLAHEIGHLILHKDFYESLKIEEYDDLIRFIEKCPREEYWRLEKQAHSFAGRVLVPREPLIHEIKNLSRRGFPEKSEIYLQDKFKVSNDVLIRRIQAEKIELDTEIFGP